MYAGAPVSRRKAKVSSQNDLSGATWGRVCNHRKQIFTTLHCDLVWMKVEDRFTHYTLFRNITSLKQPNSLYTFSHDRHEDRTRQGSILSTKTKCSEKNCYVQAASQWRRLPCAMTQATTIDKFEKKKAINSVILGTDTCLILSTVLRGQS